VSGKEVETQRFRVGDQGNKIFEFYMYQGTVIDETTEVPSLDELTNIFEGVFVRRFSRREEKAAPSTPLMCLRGGQSSSKSSHASKREERAHCGSDAQTKRP
jgi:hypothetical protein